MDDIIRMAREAGFADGVAEIVGLEGFKRLVELARADEREGCAALCDQLSDSSRDLRFGTAIRART